MNRSVKLIIAAAVLIMSGILLCFLGFLLARSREESLFKVSLSERTVQLTETFTHISFDTDDADITFVLSQDDTCKVLFRESEQQPFTAAVENGTLTIRQEDNREWHHHIGFFSGSPSMEVYLPLAVLGDLAVATSTGNVNIPEGFRFDNVRIEGSTADITFCGQVAQQLDISLSTGDIHLSQVSAEQIRLCVSTGDIALKDTACGTLSAKSNTGAQTLRNITVSGDLELSSTSGSQTLNAVVVTADARLKSTTGDIKFRGFDAANIFANTTTGDISGTILSEKTFFAKATTGNVDVPRSTQGGTCELSATTGDIIIQIVK